METARRLNLVVTLFGSILFAAMLLWVQYAPGDLATRVGDFVAADVAEKTRDRLTELAAGDEGTLTERLLASGAERALDRADDAEAALRDRLVPWVGKVVGGDCDDCAVTEGLPRVLAPLLDKAEPWVKEKFEERRDGLLWSLTIFAATNLALFAAALGLSAFKGRAAKHLLLVSGLMTLTVLLAASWYVAGQDWLLILLTGDFVGYGYSIFAGVIFLFLFDIAFLHGSITGGIINTICESLNITASVSPC
ncbi:hypothetical protein [Jannaschia pohangensis]|uniref:Uncharacterized protein n=1 Tax=Jannaschia pohangensis TaxID=390807 RepID=A0A1I3QRF0_9RHOB|nr:hypothetical protein [Jannaschia pohangensis]SFJ35697.1 hypothetical protein SAMN04488095_2616 [Jannaschia pohangensis]